MWPWKVPKWPWFLAEVAVKPFRDLATLVFGSGSESGPSSNSANKHLKFFKNDSSFFCTDPVNANGKSYYKTVYFVSFKNLAVDLNMINRSRIPMDLLLLLCLQYIKFMRRSIL
jgi:hypothetical protein